MPPPGTVIGRDYERAALVAALRRGGSAVVTGATGIGKTFLAAAVSAELASRGHRVLQVLATAAIRDIPLGALAPLLPAPPPIQDGTTLAAAREAILASAPAGLVLVIDDAHQLDGVSAALIQQLVGTGRVAALLVTRVLDMLPDAAAALASAAGTVQVAVFPLSENDCAALAETELGGQLDSTTATRLYQLSGGVPLVLRELIRLIRASGAITARRGVWSLTGRVPADTGLAHLVSVRLDELSAAQREAAEGVALAEPVELAVLERFADQLAAEQLETLGLLVTSGEDGAETLRIAHPLYAELLLAGLPRTRRRRLAQALVEACEAAGGLDPVRLALLRLSAGLASPPGALTGAGVIAGQHDRPLAERLLRAAVRAGGGVSARLALAQQLALPSPEEALELLAGLREADISPAEAIAVQITRAMALILGSGRPDEVLAELGDVARQPAPIQLVAAFAHLFAGTGPAAMAIAGPVLADERMPRPLRQRAALCLAAGLTGTGQLDEAIQVAGRFTTAGPAVPELDPDFWGISAALLLALERRGDLAEVLARGRDLLALAARRADEPGRARMLQSIGRAELLCGHPRAAVRALREVISVLRGADDTFLPWNLALLAAAEAAAGQPEAALAHLAEMDAAPRDLPVYHPEQELARAWVYAAAGEPAAAAAAAQHAAGLAATFGQAPVELLAWNLLARSGQPQAALPGARRAAAAVDGPFARLLCAQVEAIASRDPARLVEVADELAVLGADPLAAEALAAALTELRRCGDTQGLASATGKLRAALSRCEPGTLPVAALLSPAVEPGSAQGSVRRASSP